LANRSKVEFSRQNKPAGDSNKNSPFSEQQIIKILKSADAGMKVQDLCRQYGISDATYFKWKSKSGGMEAAEIQCLREIETGNAIGKPMFDDLALENRALKGLVKKALSLNERRASSQCLVKT
jgi:putative transposase